jgi:hypothetical protein
VEAAVEVAVKRALKGGLVDGNRVFPQVVWTRARRNRRMTSSGKTHATGVQFGAFLRDPICVPSHLAGGMGSLLDSLSFSGGDYCHGSSKAASGCVSRKWMV